MDRDYFIELTLLVYRLTEDFKRDFLKFKIRNLASQILADLILASQQNPGQNPTNKSFGKSSQIAPAVNHLLESLEEARAEGFISRQEFLLLKKEYERIKQEVREGINASKAIKPAEIVEIARKPEGNLEREFRDEERKVKIPLVEPNLNERQTRILESLKGGRKIQVWQLQKIFPQVSKRTLRRDLEGLLENGLVKRVGKWNEVFYQFGQEIGQG